MHGGSWSQMDTHKVCRMIDERFPLSSGHIMRRRSPTCWEDNTMRQKQVQRFEDEEEEKDDNDDDEDEKEESVLLGGQHYASEAGATL